MELRHANLNMPVVIVYRGDLRSGQGFFAKAWPEVRAVADTTGEIFAAFGLKRSTMARLFGPAVFGAFFRAVRKGHGVGSAGADPLLEPGLFLVEEDEVVWRHDFRHVGDHPDFRRLPELVSAR